MNLDLHRDLGVPDWELIPASEHNEYQIRAAATNGIDTPANRATTLGLASVMCGLYLIHKGKNKTGSVMIAFGRYQDLRDGKRAEATGTKSPFGAEFDATVDMVELGATLPVLIENELIPVHTAITIGIPKAVNTIATLASKALGKKTYVSKEGKIATAKVWFTLCGHVGSKLLEKAGHEEKAKIAKIAANICELSCLDNSIKASIGYVDNLLHGPKKSSEVIKINPQQHNLELAS